MKPIDHHMSLLMLCYFASGALFVNAQTTPPKLNRSSGTDLRLASYNVYRTSVFPRDNGAIDETRPDRLEAFSRIAKAIDADIWMLQECIYGPDDSVGRTEAGLAEYFQTILPADPNDSEARWHYGKKATMLLSRYPILWRKKVGRGYAYLVDLPAEVSSKDLLIINLHLVPRSGNKREHASLVTDLLKDIRGGTETGFPKEIEFSIIIGGDFNSQINDIPYRILSSQNKAISSSGSYDAIFDDASPAQLGSDPLTYLTVGSVQSLGENRYSHSGNRIDFLMLEKGHFSVVNSFILNTLIQEDAWLTANQLERRDVALFPKKIHSSYNPSQCGSHDHLPIVLDLNMGAHTAAALYEN